jgi:hypothetical protein
MLTPAEQLFSETQGRILRAWSTVSIFRRFVDAGFDAAKQAQIKDAETLWNSVISDPQYTKLVYDVDQFRKTFPKEKFAEAIAKQSTEMTTNLINAATILFGHSMMDAAVFDFCRVTALHAPDDWKVEVSNRQVPLSKLREQPLETIEAAKLNEFLADLEMKSLAEKIDRLHARCRPKNNWSPMVGYVFDREKIKRLDLLRQGIVHGDALGQPIADAAGEFLYMHRTCWYFMGLVHMRYGIRMDPSVAFSGKSEQQ